MLVWPLPAARGGISTPASDSLCAAVPPRMRCPPTTVPDYIFPFLSSQHFSVANINYFTQLMYRPLYWFGSSGRPYSTGR